MSRIIVTLLSLLLTIASEIGGERIPTTHEHNLKVAKQGHSKWRVMNGRDANMGQFPFVVSLDGCTGSILDETTILTAVHCVCGGQSLVRAAILTKHETYDETQDRSVVSIIRNPQHEVDTNGICLTSGAYDMAIIKLNRPLAFNHNVRPIEKIHCGNTAPPPETPIINIGYGFSRDGGVTNILRYGRNTLTSDVCGYSFICSKRDDKQGRVQNVVAPGDSGGPVVRELPDGKLEQIGVNSGATNTMGFYAPTYLNCDWLRSVTKLPQ
jgi:hypothetical protein